MEFKGTKGVWSVGKTGGAVVSTDKTGFENGTGHLDVEYYGGALIAESIHKHADAYLISAAPDLLNACIAALDNSDRNLNTINNGERSAECQKVYDKVLYAINKALGNG